MENDNNKNNTNISDQTLFPPQNINPIPTKPQSSQLDIGNQNKFTKIDSDDLKKAIIFLMGKELKDYSMEKKREYLSRKISSETLEKAMEIYPIIEANTNAKIEDFIKDYEKKNNKSSFFDGLFDLGVLTTVIISTLGINYLLDLQRNKKNEIFYKESEKKLNEELMKISENMKKDIGNELSNFCKKNEVEDKIKEKIQLHNQNTGLNLNLGSKNLKENINNLKNELSSHEQKLKEMSVKLDNSGVIMKQDVLKEISSLIEDNNKNLLMKIIEMQNKLIIDTNNNANANANANFSNNKKDKVQDKGLLNESNAKADNSSINFKKNVESEDKNLNNLIYCNKETTGDTEKIKEIQDYFNSAFPSKEETTTVSQIYNIENIPAKDDIEIKDGNLTNPIMTKKSNLEDNFNLNNKLSNTENIATSTIISDYDILANKEKEANQPELKREIDFISFFDNILKTLDESKKNNFILQIKVIKINSI